jgi:hypothetical protein
MSSPYSDESIRAIFAIFIRYVRINDYPYMYVKYQDYLMDLTTNYPELERTIPLYYCQHIEQSIRRIVMRHNTSRVILQVIPQDEKAKIDRLIRELYEEYRETHPSFPVERF